MADDIFICMNCGQSLQIEDQTDRSRIIICPSCQQNMPIDDCACIVDCPICKEKLALPVKYRDQKDVTCCYCDSNINVADLLNASSEQETAPTMLNPDDVFDKYRIIRLLGRGGMAEVYLAEHTILKQLVALKILLQNEFATSETGIKRFIREAKLTHKIKHPNIVEAKDAGIDSRTGMPFIAMEYIDGKSLSEISQEGQLSEKELKAIFESMLKALKKLRKENIVHRDIKPSNIMLTSNGEYKLMDLGIARAESDYNAGEMTLTCNNSAVGTFNYASPEQCQSAHDVDFRSDIYSLGATLYTLATGKVPHEGTSTLEVILSVLNNNPEDLKTLRPDLSDNLISIIDWMMKKSPSDRPMSLEQLEHVFHKNKITLLTSTVRRKLSAIKNNKTGRIIISLLLIFVILVSLYSATQTAKEIFGDNSPYGQTTEIIRSAKLSELPLIASYDFTRNCNLEKSNVMVHTWTFRGPITEYERARAVAVPGMNQSAFTVSVDYRYNDSINDEQECWKRYRLGCSTGNYFGDFNFGLRHNVQLLIYDNRVSLCFYDAVIRTGVKVKNEKWTNYTISYDREMDLLTLYIDQKYIGSYNVHKKYSDPKNEFYFHCSAVMPDVKKTFRNFKVYNGVLTAPKNCKPTISGPRYVVSPLSYDDFEEASIQAKKQNKELIVALTKREGTVEEWQNKHWKLYSNAIRSCKSESKTFLRKGEESITYSFPHIVVHDIAILNTPDKKTAELMKKWNINMNMLPIIVVLHPDGKLKHYILNGEELPSPVPTRMANAL